MQTFGRTCCFSTIMLLILILYIEHKSVLTYYTKARPSLNISYALGMLEDVDLWKKVFSGYNLAHWMTLKYGKLLIPNVQLSSINRNAHVVTVDSPMNQNGFDTPTV